MKTLVVLRSTCAVHSVHAPPRPFGWSKEQCNLVCFQSLVKNVLTPEHDLFVVSDRNCEGILNLYKTCPNFIGCSTDAQGNSETAAKAIQVALDNKDKYQLFYILEDDYFHSSLEKKQIKKITSDWKFCQPDPDPMFIIPFSDQVHLREEITKDLSVCRGSFFTFYLNKAALLKHGEGLLAAAKNPEVDDGYMWREVYKDSYIQTDRSLALAPRPFPAVHFHQGYAPEFDFKTEFENLNYA